MRTAWTPACSGSRDGAAHLSRAWLSISVLWAYCFGLIWRRALFLRGFVSCWWGGALLGIGQAGLRCGWFGSDAPPRASSVASLHRLAPRWRSSCLGVVSSVRRASLGPSCGGLVLGGVLGPARRQFVSFVRGPPLHRCLSRVLLWALVSCWGRAALLVVKSLPLGPHA